MNVNMNMNMNVNNKKIFTKTEIIVILLAFAALMLSTVIISVVEHFNTINVTIILSLILIVVGWMMYKCMDLDGLIYRKVDNVNGENEGKMQER